jgi:hypothetical protein
MRRYWPHLVAVLALGAAFVHGKATDPRVQRVSAGLVPLLLGVPMLGWGLRELRAGSVLVQRRHARREEHPATFWIVLLAFRFAPGAVMVGAGLWYLFLRGPS